MKRFRLWKQRVLSKSEFGPHKQTFNEATQALEDRGSVSPLIIGYFTIAMLLIFLISNVSAVYIERRDLITRVEESLAIAAQQLDEFRYYYGSPLTEYLASSAIENGELLVPIDCASADEEFRRHLAMRSMANQRGYSNRASSSLDYTLVSSLNSPATFVSNSPSTLLSNSPSIPTASSTMAIKEYEIVSFSCDGLRLSATVRESFDLPFQLRVLNLQTFVNEVKVGVESRYLP